MKKFILILLVLFTGVFIANAQTIKYKILYHHFYTDTSAVNLSKNIGNIKFENDNTDKYVKLEIMAYKYYRVYYIVFSKAKAETIEEYLVEKKRWNQVYNSDKKLIKNFSIMLIENKDVATLNTSDYQLALFENGKITNIFILKFDTVY